MMRRAGVVVKGIPKLQRKIQSYAASLLAPASMWEIISRELAAAETAWFQSEGEGSWAPLSASYAEKKGMEFPGQPLLVREGDLLEWMSNPSMAAKITAPDVLQWVNGRSTPDGRWNIAELHRDGTGRMPARSPVLPLDRLKEIAYAAARVQAAWR